MTIEADLDEPFPHDLQLYDSPPFGDVKLEEMQQWCVDRLKVLKLVEKIWRENYRKPSKFCLALLTKELEERELNNFVTLLTSPGCESQTPVDRHLRKNDCLSHFLLRSAFAFQFEKRLWFFVHEVTLFRWRFSSLNRKGAEAFYRINGLRFDPISVEEKSKIAKCLEMSSPSVDNVDCTTFYKVEFQKVKDLVANRRIFLSMGSAYVPEAKMCSVIIYEFKKVLNRGFEHARAVASNSYDDERLAPIFGILPKRVKSNNYRERENKPVSIDELDELSQTSFPLCMRMVHTVFRKKHHLTNGGRFQYGLFLKGIGLTLDESIKFWEEEFLKGVDKGTFEKRYKYHIRHFYGVEGRRANYRPFSCTKIINAEIGPRDSHGCPFMNRSIAELKATLAQCGFVRADVEAVAEHAIEGSYTNACKKYYEIMHNCITDKVFDHPNIYFKNSMDEFMY